ncbi:Uncharacterised protein [Mycobacteroides abscessus]|nr:Uncharacterised protein [Mycobacteroides abscessus]
MIHRGAHCHRQRNGKCYRADTENQQQRRTDQQERLTFGRLVIEILEFTELGVGFSGAFGNRIGVRKPRSGGSLQRVGLSQQCGAGFEIGFLRRGQRGTAGQCQLGLVRGIHWQRDRITQRLGQIGNVGVQPQQEHAVGGVFLALERIDQIGQHPRGDSRDQRLTGQADYRTVGGIDHRQRRGLRLDHQQRRLVISGDTAGGLGQGSSGMQRREEFDAVDPAACQGVTQFGGLGVVAPHHTGGHQIVATVEHSVAGTHDRREHLFGSCSLTLGNNDGVGVDDPAVRARSLDQHQAGSRRCHRDTQHDVHVRSSATYRHGHTNKRAKAVKKFESLPIMYRAGALPRYPS